MKTNAIRQDRSVRNLSPIFKEAPRGAVKSVSRTKVKAVLIPENPGVVDQIKVAFRPENVLGMSMGLIIGGFIPFGIYFVMHHEVQPALALVKGEVTLASMHALAMLLLAVAGLLFSAKTVWQWGYEGFRQDAWKASGCVVILEGIMSISTLTFLTIAALVLLVTINAIATGVILSQGRRL